MSLMNFCLLTNYLCTIIRQVFRYDLYVNTQPSFQKLKTNHCDKRNTKRNEFYFERLAVLPRAAHCLYYCMLQFSIKSM